MKFNNNKGFTLVEMLATVVILGLIMIVALPIYSSVYNSVKSTTYLNTIKTIRTSALDYGSNTYIKDSIKSLSYNGTDWCKTVYMSDLIKGGYLRSDDDKDIITDLYTGESIGYNSLIDTSRPDYDVAKSTVSLCYCKCISIYINCLIYIWCYSKDTLDIEAFLTKDLGVNQTYIAGEYIRVLYESGSYSFGYVKKDFSYNEILSAVIKTIKSGNYTYNYEGIELNLSGFAEMTDISKDNSAFMSAFNSLIASSFTSFNKCEH